MEFIMYLLYCMSTTICLAFGDSGGTTVEHVIGLACILVLAVVIIGMISLSNFLAKKIKKKKGIYDKSKKVFLHNGK